MARLVDETKMERIKEAAIELIVEKGYGGASISSIAKKAEVADGYLYRFHKSKLELINQLLHSKISIIIDKMEELLKSFTSIDNTLSALIDILFTTAKNRPQDIKFLYVLMHDYNFQISEEQRQVIRPMIKRVRQLGIDNGEINQRNGEEELFNMAITYPIIYINQRFKGLFNTSKWTKDDQKRITEFCINALK